MPARLRRDIRDSLLPHWHDELEIAWIFQGHNIHCISGHRYLSQPGTLVITNCESVHKIIPVEEELSEGPRRSIILLVSRDFHTRFFPEYPGKIRFRSILEDAPKEIKDLLPRTAKRMRGSPMPTLHGGALAGASVFALFLRGGTCQSSTLPAGQRMSSSV